MSIFSQVSNPNPPSNTFDLSHDRKFSGQIGQLIPTLCQETVPGDRMNIKASNMLRFAFDKVQLLKLMGRLRRSRSPHLRMNRR